MSWEFPFLPFLPPVVQKHSNHLNLWLEFEVEESDRRSNYWPVKSYLLSTERMSDLNSMELNSVGIRKIGWCSKPPHTLTHIESSLRGLKQVARFISPKIKNMTNKIFSRFSPLILPVCFCLLPCTLLRATHSHSECQYQESSPASPISETVIESGPAFYQPWMNLMHRQE